MIRQIGLTGGIGSGKSTVARIFQTFGFEVYFADDRAKGLTESHPGVVAQIKEEFGHTMYDDAGKLDRKALAGIVFKDKEALARLNAIVHPATFEDFENWLAEIGPGYGKNFILKEAAILFEAGSWKDLDGVITVFAPKQTRIARVCKRDGVTPEQVMDRMKNQLPEEFKLKNADYVIYNDGEHHLIPQVQRAIDYFSAR